jgi:hypothetical protein
MSDSDLLARFRLYAIDENDRQFAKECAAVADALERLTTEAAEQQAVLIRAIRMLGEEMGKRKRAERERDAAAAERAAESREVPS